MKLPIAQKGFTLIELLIVVAIIGVLAAIAVPNFLNAQIRAKIAKAVSELNTFTVANEMYRTDNGNYYPHTNGHFAWQNKYLTTPIAYVSAVPKDPFQDKLRPTDAIASLTFYEYHKDPIWNEVYKQMGFSTGELDYRTRHLQSPENIKRIEAGRPFAYELWSLGPNYQLDFPSGHFVYYEMSNGVGSVGDIVWIRP
ncbi:MAG: prepilin-type N-terminal cleavage/methylation domain-containing protein [Candidatus Omnitrophota bacterium]